MGADGGVLREHGSSSLSGWPFKDYLLPLLFVKRLSDVFDELERILMGGTAYSDAKRTLNPIQAGH